MKTFQPIQTKPEVTRNVGRFISFMRILWSPWTGWQNYRVNPKEEHRWGGAPEDDKNRFLMSHSDGLAGTNMATLRNFVVISDTFDVILIFTMSIAQMLIMYV